MLREREIAADTINSEIIGVKLEDKAVTVGVLVWRMMKK